MSSDALGWQLEALAIFAFEESVGLLGELAGELLGCGIEVESDTDGERRAFEIDFVSIEMLHHALCRFIEHGVFASGNPFIERLGFPTR